MGAVLLTAADIAVRLVPANPNATAIEIKLGVVTAIIGVPFFLAMIFRERRLMRRSVVVTAQPKLHAGDVVVRLGDALIVDGASLDLARRRAHVLIGPNGAGKTTLMRALAGLVPAEGRIEIDGKPLAGLHAARPRAAHRLSAAGPRVPLADAGRRRGRARPLRLWRCVLGRHRCRPAGGRQGAGGHRHRRLRQPRGDHALRRRARARRAGAGARLRGADPARRRADGIARSAPSADGDGASGARRA